MKNEYWLEKARWLKYPVLSLFAFSMSTPAFPIDDDSESKLEKSAPITVAPTKLPETLQDQQKKTRFVTGTVLDDTDGTAIIGANVIIKGTSTGVTTDVNGQFSIAIPIEGATLQISYLGYKQEEVYITDQGVITVRMVLDNELLSEVVVVGAGTQKKISVTGSITSLEGAKFIAPTSSFTSNLSGKLAGVISSTSSGEPGSTSEFYIRGVGTFGGRATPLIICDGVEIAASDLDRIPAETIESFSVLKDASATAIYGSRGANGVMIVTTKSGVENTPTRVNVTVENSFVTPTKMVEYLDGASWMELYNEAQYARDPNAIPRYTQEVIDLTRSGVAPYIYPDVDWQDIMFKNMTMNQRANINITGGGNRATYYISLQANHDTGMLDIPKNYSFDNNINRWNYNFQSNVGYKLSKTTKLDLRLNAQIGTSWVMNPAKYKS